MFRGADPIRVDRLDVTRISLAAPAQEELLGGRLPARDDVVGNNVRLAVGDPSRARDDGHHLCRETTEVFARLPVGDLVQLAEPPFAGDPRRLGLEVSRRVAREPCGLVRLRIRHARVEVVVDEQTPDVFVGVMADELLDVNAAVAKRAAFAIGLGDLRLDRDDAFEPRLEIVVAAHRSSNWISWPIDRSRAAASTSDAAAASWTATPTDLYRVI